MALILTLAAMLAPARPAGSHEPAGPATVTPGSPLSANPSLAVIRPAPEFSLVDAGGRSVRLSDLRGRVVLLSFIYTACPSACPLVTQRMALLQQRLVTTGLLPWRVVLLSITVDPARDTREVLARYAGAFGARPDGWRFLRGSPERLAGTLAAYDEWTRVGVGGEIDHPARLHLVDAGGRIREIYDLARFDERQAFLDIRAVLRPTPSP